MKVSYGRGYRIIPSKKDTIHTMREAPPIPRIVVGVPDFLLLVDKGACPCCGFYAPLFSGLAHFRICLECAQ